MLTCVLEVSFKTLSICNNSQITCFWKGRDHSILAAPTKTQYQTSSETISHKKISAKNRIDIHVIAFM